jgi:molybdopterin converting factor small subunit
MAVVAIPLLLSDVTGGARHAEVAGTTLAEIIAALDALHPGIAARIRDGEKIKPNVALTVDGKIAARGLDTPVRPDSQVAILPAFGGG